MRYSGDGRQLAICAQVSNGVVDFSVVDHGKAFQLKIWSACNGVSFEAAPQTDMAAVSELVSRGWAFAEDVRETQSSGAPGRTRPRSRRAQRDAA
jgi:hypothetical protein